MVIPEITINDQTLQKMTDDVLQPIDSALSNLIDETATPCVKSAKDFLTSIKKAYRELTAANILAKHQLSLKQAMKNPDNDVDKLTQEYERNKVIFKELYLKSQIVNINVKMEEFSKQLNSFLNQKAQLTFVYTTKEGKHPVILLVDNLEQIMKKDMASKGAGIKVSINMANRDYKQAIKGHRSAIQKLAEEKYLSIKQIENLKESYDQVVDRFNKHEYYVKNNKSKNKGKEVHVIIWQPQIDWKVVVMGNNKGDLKEAYVSAVIGRKGFVYTKLDQNIDDFMAYVSQVDATPGMLQGDVSERLKDGSTIEYAVKGANASFMGINLAVKLAIQILTAKPPFDEAALRRKKRQYAKDIKPRNQQITIQELRKLFNNKIPNNLKATMNL